ncbi:hypothetical protein HPB51_001936 [Rhipicephalus microplus]|uniref:SWIM-type domain-containing protein n=1 Tax=Rhipicephalus microplus TaxID=6941 RepID=A0A9J6EEK7_RHIMP|nr:hypothetical protein HPB51_001936 [Rhipicephalus microplus]
MDEGAKFDSFVEFDRAFRDFQVTTNTLFVTKASKTVDIVNSRLSAGLTKFHAKLKFANITYACKHGGAVRKTGSGIRPQQRTMKKGCPAKIIVAARRASQQLEVTAVNLEHNHEVSPETYKAYSECRQLNEEEVNFVRPLIEQHVVTSLLEIFVQENSAATNTKVVVIDKDFTEVNAVKAAFPGSPAVQLCEFHVKKAFQTAAAQLGKSPDERKRLLGSFSEMLHAPTPQKYDDAKAEFERYACSEAISYFAKNWSNITEMWVRYHCDQEFTGGNNTNNRVESHNAKIKNVLSSSSKLHEALRGLLKLSTSLSQEAHHKTILLKTCDFYSYERHEGVQEQCRKVLTPYACKLLSNELVKLRDEPREVKKLSPRTYAVFSTSTDVWHDVFFEKHSCSCTTYKKMKLLCRHMLAVCARFDVKPCLKEAVSRRWFKSYQLEFLGTTADNHEQDDIDSESTTESSAEIQALSMPGPSFQKMNRNQCFNYAMRTLKAIADNLADCQPDVFAARLGFLESVNAAWLRQEDVALSHHEKDKVQAPENSTAQDVGSADMLHADEEQQLLDNNQPSGSIEPLISSSETGSSTNQESTTSSFVSEIRLPHVKSRGRPNKRVLQNRFKRPREQDDDRPVPFRQLTEKSQTKCKED